MEKQTLTQLKIETDPRRPIAYVFLFLLPFLALLILFIIIRKNPLDFHLLFSDELDYWAETATLMKRGLLSSNAGYFGYSFANHARFLYFGAHGFFSLIPYALFGYFAPRTHVTILALNALFMGLSFSTSYYLIGSLRKILAIALPVFAFYPFYLYYQTGMLETLYYAGSIFLAVFCVKCFTPGPRQWCYLKLYFWMVILFSLFRLSNFVLLIPAFLGEIGLQKRSLLLTLFKYGVAAVTVAVLSILPAASYPWGFLGELGNSGNVLGLVLANTLNNIRLLFDLKTGYSLEILPRFLFIGWWIFMCVYLIITRKRNTREKKLFLLSLIFAMLALILLNITLYEINSFRDLRVFSPVLVFSMIAFFLYMRDRFSTNITVAFTLIFLLASFFPIIKERDLVWDFFFAGRYETANPPLILSEIHYNPEARTRWENSAYVDRRIYGSLDWRNYDPGIGIMVLSPEEIESLKEIDPGSLLKAEYIISSQEFHLPGYDLSKSISNFSLYIKTD